MCHYEGYYCGKKNISGGSGQAIKIVSCDTVRLKLDIAHLLNFREKFRQFKKGGVCINLVLSRILLLPTTNTPNHPKNGVLLSP